MKAHLKRPGLSGLVFAALLLAFNWPIVSIPAPDELFAWLFTAWGLGIGLLFLAARGDGKREPKPPRKPGEG